MRLTYNSEWMDDYRGNIIGVNLGADYCAEHEWGITKLQDILGIVNNPSIFGIEKRIINNFSGVLFEGNRLIIDSEWKLEWYREKKNSYSNIKCLNNKLTAYWDGESLAIAVPDFDKDKLKLIADAIYNRDCAIWRGGGGIFENPGLCLGIVSRIPQEYKSRMFESDQDAWKLSQTSEATGIKSKIDKYNDDWRKSREVETGSRCFESPRCGYYALSPAWNIQNRKTKYKVIYWLNPYHQDTNNYGWYTVEELEKWILGEGPIPKKETSNV